MKERYSVVLEMPLRFRFDVEADNTDEAVTAAFEMLDGVELSEGESHDEDCTVVSCERTS